MTISGLDSLVDDLVRERDRIAFERVELLASRGLLFDPLGLQERADACLALLDAIDRHVGEALPRLEVRAAAGDVGAAAAALSSTRRILAAVSGVRPVDDAILSAGTLVRDISSSVVPVVGGAVVVFALGVLAFLVLR